MDTYSEEYLELVELEKELKLIDSFVLVRSDKERHSTPK